MPAGAITGTVVEASIKIYVYKDHHSIQINVGGYKSWLWHWITRRCTWRAPETIFFLHWYINSNCDDNVPGLAGGQFPAVLKRVRALRCQSIFLPSWKLESGNMMPTITVLPMDLSKYKCDFPQVHTLIRRSMFCACLLVWSKNPTSAIYCLQFSNTTRSNLRDTLVG